MLYYKHHKKKKLTKSRTLNILITSFLIILDYWPRPQVTGQEHIRKEVLKMKFKTYVLNKPLVAISRMAYFYKKDCTIISGL